MNTKLLLWIVGVSGFGALVLLGIGAGPGTARGEAAACPDLVPSISLFPDPPPLGGAADIVVTVQNQGTGISPGYWLYVYVDPGDQPPTATTPETTRVRPLGLGPGSSAEFTYGYTFATPGQHVIYAWVDRNDQIPGECNELNNLVRRVVCVGTGTCGPDNYEGTAGDDTCNTASAITPNGSIQRRNLYPMGDADWIKFQAQGGVEYLLAARNLGPDADPVFELSDSCTGEVQARNPKSLGDDVTMLQPIAADGTYFVKVSHRDANHGDETNYDFSITPTCSADTYETDDQCGLARDLEIDGAPQVRSFCRRNDQDWHLFYATAGTRYRVLTQNWGTNSQPIVEIRSSCDTRPVLTAGARGAVEWVATQSGPIYVNLHNSDPQAAGLNTGYQVRAVTVQNEDDAFEPDDSAAAAKPLPGAAPQTHSLSRPGDQDWVYFDLVGNQRYRLETLGLTAGTDTVLCLYAQGAATPLACDDDGGEGLGSLLWWQAPSSGRFYARVSHFSAAAGGAQARYQLLLTAAPTPCDQESWEPNGSNAQAFEIVPGAQPQVGTFCPAQDQDWVRFRIATPGIYAILAEHTGADADPILDLYDVDGSTRLFSSDDYGPGIDARILWRFDRSGVYFARIRSFDGRSVGRGAEYRIQVSASQIVPTPIPTQTPAPTPTFTPTPLPTATPTLAATPRASGPVRTLIITHRQRLARLYGQESADAALAKLEQLAAYGAAPGQVVSLDTHPELAEKFRQWDAKPADAVLANAIADAIRNIVLVQRQLHPELEFVVLAGDDRIIPFRRVKDRGDLPKNEHQYNIVAKTSTVGSALAGDYSLTDDFYGTSQIQTILETRPLYLPDLAVGRLVETPAEIASAVDKFLADDQIDLKSVLVVAVDPPDVTGQRSTATGICKSLEQAHAGSVDCNWRSSGLDKTAFLNRHLATAPPFELQVLGVGGNHSAYRVNTNTSVNANELAASGADLGNALILTSAAHGGLNVAPDDPNPQDLPQTYLRLGGVFVGSTGYGALLSKGAVGFTGSLMNHLVRQVYRAPTVGKAWVESKQNFWNEIRKPEELHRKVSHIATLYGIPMYRLPEKLAGEEFPSVQWRTAIAASALGVQPAVPMTFTLELPPTKTDVDGGSYYALEGHTDWDGAEPGQPNYFVELGAIGPLSGDVRDVIWRGGTYTDVTGFVPLRPEVVADDGETMVQAAAAAGTDTGQNWSFPAAVDPDARRLSIDWGQFDSLRNMQRNYGEQAFEFTVSTLPDVAAPTASYAAARELPTGPLFKLDAQDRSGIRQVVVVYTADKGVWRAVDLTYQPDMDKWVGEVQTKLPIRWFAQVVDGAGNVGAVLDKGRLFSAEPRADPPPAPIQTGFNLFLPAVRR